MIAYLCSIGERTTEVCKWQLERMGFDVVLLDGDEKWFDKYTRFLNTATGDCIRIDADIIINDKLILDIDQIPEKTLMAQFRFWDFYRNEEGVGNPCFYSAEALEIIKANFDQLDESRPETSAWRLPEINDFTWTGNRLCGIHGVAQDKATIVRAKKNKKDRKQIDLYDFELVDKINSIK